MKIVYLSHMDRNLYLFRLPVMQAMVQRGHDVFALCPAGEVSERFAEYGIEHISYTVRRRSLNPFREWGTLREIGTVLRTLQPDLVHAFAHKPNIYAALAYPGRVIQTVTGLGSFYTHADWRSILVRQMIDTLYRFSASRASRVIFQNRDDMELFLSRGILPESKAVLVRSSGVDMKRFAPRLPDRSLMEQHNLDPGLPTVLMIARVIRDKGVQEYIDAAERLKGLANFVYVGEVDYGNPGAYLPEWKSVHHVGYQESVDEWIALSDIVVLPSYREGVPRTLLEAASMGKPIVTTDVPGCREVVRDEINGLLVPSHDAKKLAEAIFRLLSDPECRERMGEAGRRIATDEFSVERVVESYLKIYREIREER